MRQMLADKVSGDLAGVWLLVAEHLRLGTWDLLRGWTGQPGERVEPRLALQCVHEAAVCTAGIRAERTLHRRGGFELVNGLPFVATDVAVHELLAQRTVADSQRLQVALGKLRLASGHFQGKLLAVDPHRVLSHSRRRMRERVERAEKRPAKMAQTFWILDADTQQPIAFTTATAARSVVSATPELLDLTSQILVPRRQRALVLADTEHFAGALLADVQRRPNFDLLAPLPSQPAYRAQYRAIPAEQFRRHWAGFATTKVPYTVKYGQGGTYCQFVERSGDRPPIGAVDADIERLPLPGVMEDEESMNLVLGSLVHEFFKQLAVEAAPLKVWKEVFNKVWSKSENISRMKGGGLFRLILLGQLEALAEHENENERLLLFGGGRRSAEKSLAAGFGEGGRFGLNGRLDAVVEAAGTCTILDYKYKGSQTVGKKSLAEGLDNQNAVDPRLQLALYAYLLSRAGRIPLESVRGCFVYIREDDPAKRFQPLEEIEILGVGETMRALSERIEQVISRERFEPNYKSSGCRSCLLKSLCKVENFYRASRGRS